MNAFTDYSLLFLAYWGMRGLQLTHKNKAATFFILALGIVAGAAGISRSVVGHAISINWSFSRRRLVEFLAMALEASIGFVCFCLPAARGVAENSRLLRSRNFALGDIWQRVKDLLSAWWGSVKVSWIRYIWPGKRDHCPNSRDTLNTETDSQVELVVDRKL